MFWTEFFGVVFHSSKYGVDGFMINGINMQFSFRLRSYEVAFEQRFEVMRDHALFLTKCSGEFVNAHGLTH